MAGPMNGPGINSINQQAKPGQMNLPQALWHVLKIIGTPNKNSQVGGFLGQVASQAKNPVNMAMMLPGMDNLEPYNLPKAMTSGHVVFRESQPYDIRDGIGRLKALKAREQGNFGIDKLPHMQSDITARQTMYTQRLYDALFHQFNGAGFPQPPRP